jgi:hypothetical protein
MEPVSVTFTTTIAYLHLITDVTTCLEKLCHLFTFADLKISIIFYIGYLLLCMFISLLLALLGLRGTLFLVGGLTLLLLTSVHMDDSTLPLLPSSDSNSSNDSSSNISESIPAKVKVNEAIGDSSSPNTVIKSRPSSSIISLAQLLLQPLCHLWSRVPDLLEVHHRLILASASAVRADGPEMVSMTYSSVI